MDFEEFLRANNDYQTIPFLKKCYDEKKVLVRYIIQ